MRCGCATRWSRRDRGERPLIEAIGAYEAGMRDYGFKAVRNSLRAMEQMTSDSADRAALSRAAFRDHRPAAAGQALVRARPGQRVSRFRSVIPKSCRLFG